MRSRCGLSVREARALPWHEWQALLEGLEWDLARESGEEPEEVHETDDLASLGVTVRQVG